MGKRVRTSKDESLECESWVEWRSSQRLVHCRDWPRKLAKVVSIGPVFASLSLWSRQICGLRARRWDAQNSGAHGQLDPRYLRLLRPPAGEHLLGIMGLNPAPEEARGN